MKPKSPELLARAAMKAQAIHQPIASGARAKRRLIIDERIQLRTHGEIEASWFLAVHHQIMGRYLLRVGCAGRLGRPRSRPVR